ETANVGKPIKESTFMDIPASAATFEHFAHNLDRYLQSENIEINSNIAQANATIAREPVGVTALVVPWNYPLLIASWKLAQSLAAGNTVVLKPSSLTPLSALLLGTIIHKAGLPAGVVNVINAPGEAVGELLCGDPRVDMISFTGSNTVGKKIVGYSARHAKKTIMELGGKSAGIVLADADREFAVNGSLCSIFLNQGQMCTAMSRILIHERLYDRFVSDFVEKAKRIKLGDPRDFETQMGPLISRRQQDEVCACVERAAAQGAKVLCGGKIPRAPQFSQGFFFEPTVLENVNPDSEVFREEVFGPVVCVSSFKTDEEAIACANDSRFGLASSVWSADTSNARSLAQKISAGTVWINTYGMFFNELPYGGFKESGFGKELGKEGLREYTRLKNVVVDATVNARPLVHYWYGF
ncbi:MAG: aldehyde dehydrogenase family protein, partial [Candidatus Omnitrophica bacterium]|nr:aldehyde dehydrogenase family protein [Candidatus Omnitrophota bacterium]